MFFLYLLSLLLTCVCFALLEWSLYCLGVSGGGCVLIILLLFIEISSPAVVQAGLNVSFLSVFQVLESQAFPSMFRLILNRVGFVRLFKSFFEERDLL